ncbi:MAG: beta-propeller domain-containing protein [Ruminococcus sp.]|nr:beta-propeller domain-containing protein [Ruminococcus sp.]
MTNDEKLREQMKSAPVPERLKPENIKIMLDNEIAKKKRSRISMAGRITAAAAACTVIGGTAVYTLNNRGTDIKTSVPVKKSDVTTTAPVTDKPESKVLTSYMSGASDYEQIYTMFNKAAKKAQKEQKKYYYTNDIVEEAVADATVAAGAFDEEDTNLSGRIKGINGYGSELHETPVITEDTTEPGPEPETVPPEDTTDAPEEPVKEEDPEHSETYYQEQDVLEADIVKTDGKHIYYLANDRDEDYKTVPVLRTADVKDGKFTGSSVLDICESVDIQNSSYNIRAVDMYVYNDMIAVICSNNQYGLYYSDDYDEIGYNVQNTFVAFYTTGDEPQLIDVYKQDGCYSDVRISPDGYMLLTSTYNTTVFDRIKDSDDTRRYIPYCGFAESYDIIPPEDILLPAGGFGSTDRLSYTVIGSIDLNAEGAPAEKDIKTLAGYTGSIYCSADNLYTAAWSEDYRTDITRISIKGGDIVPMAGTTINGEVKDQFSMSEYDGYFRVAATYTEVKKTFHSYDDDDSNFIKEFWDYLTDEERKGYYTYENIRTDTRVYVLDMELNTIGSVDGLGVGEQLKSASFSGNMAYVVTFRQTDPLYAVDLSDPANPVVLDEFKINGFSTYMQQWSNGLLLGFGQDADENGRITGIRMTMFDNSDPNNLKAEAVYTWNNSPSNYNYGNNSEWSEEYYNSPAVYERKSLLIAPGKNLIGVPVEYSRYAFSDWGKLAEYTERSQYVFFSYENGEFVLKGDITNILNESNEYAFYTEPFNRAVYIGDYVYALSSKKFVAADINTIGITDELDF